MASKNTTKHIEEQMKCQACFDDFGIDLDLFRRPFGDFDSVIQNQSAIAEVHNEFHVMFYDHYDVIGIV